MSKAIWGSTNKRWINFQPSNISGELARHMLEIMVGALRSAEAGQVVELSTRFDLPDWLD
jgi:hypothetical protein